MWPSCPFPLLREPGKRRKDKKGEGRKAVYPERTRSAEPPQVWFDIRDGSKYPDSSRYRVIPLVVLSADDRTCGTLAYAWHEAACWLLGSYSWYAPWMVRRSEINVTKQAQSDVTAPSFTHQQSASGIVSSCCFP